jgi:hypothetical protein
MGSLAVVSDSGATGAAATGRGNLVVRLGDELVLVVSGARRAPVGGGAARRTWDLDFPGREEGRVKVVFERGAGRAPLGSRAGRRPREGRVLE